MPRATDRLFVSGAPTSAFACEYQLGGGSTAPIKVSLAGVGFYNAVMLLGSLPPPGKDPTCPEPSRSDLLFFTAADGTTSAVRIDPASGCTFAWGDTDLHSYAPAKLLWELVALNQPATSAVPLPTAVDYEPYRGPLALAFPTARHGVLLAVDCPLLPGDCTLFSEVSDDGGETWSTRTTILAAHWTAPGDPPYQFASGQLAFASASVGYAFGGPGLYKTTDGGHTWTQLKVDGKVGALTIAGDTAWAVVLHGCNESACTGWDLDVVHADGHLTVMPNKPSLPPWPDGSAVAVPSELLRPDADTAYLVTYNSVQVTHNGGATWSRQATPCVPNDGELASVSAGDPTMLWAVCSSGMGAGGENKQLWRSTDSGASWRGPSALEIGGYSHQITAVDARTAWRYGARGNLFRTSDSGRTWQVLLPNVFDGGGGPPSSFAAVGTEDAWVFDPFGPYGTEQRSLYITTDGGNTWHVVAVFAGSSP